MREPRSARHRTPTNRRKFVENVGESGGKIGKFEGDVGKTVENVEWSVGTVGKCVGNAGWSVETVGKLGGLAVWWLGKRGAARDDGGAARLMAETAAATGSEIILAA